MKTKLASNALHTVNAYGSTRPMQLYCAHLTPCCHTHIHIACVCTREHNTNSFPGFFVVCPAPSGSWIKPRGHGFSCQVRVNVLTRNLIESTLSSSVNLAHIWYLLTSVVGLWLFYSAPLSQLAAMCSLCCMCCIYFKQVV